MQLQPVGSSCDRDDDFLIESELLLSLLRDDGGDFLGEETQLCNSEVCPLSTFTRLTVLFIAFGCFPSLSAFLERRLPCFKKTCSASALVLPCFRTSDSLSLATFADVFSSTIGEG